MVLQESITKVSDLYNILSKDAGKSLSIDTTLFDTLSTDMGILAQYANDATVSLSEASAVAQKFASSAEISRDAIEGFADKQRIANVEVIAGNKTLSNCRALINEYNSALESENHLTAISGVSQADFATAVGKSNSVLGSYLTGLNGAEASMGGYVVKLGLAKAATLALRVGTIALNMALSAGLSFILSEIISQFSDWVNAEKDAREETIEAGKEAVEEADNLYELASAYAAMSEAVKNGEGSSEDLADSQDSVISALKEAGREVDNLTGSYTKLYESIINATDAQLQNDIGDAAEYAKAQEEQALEDLKTGFWGGNSNTLDFYADSDSKAIAKYLEEQGYSGISFGTYTFGDGNYSRTGEKTTISLPSVSLEGGKSSIENLLADYEYLGEVKNAISEQFGVDSAIYEAISDQYDIYKEALEAVLEANDSTNELIAEKEINEAQLGNIPETLKEYETFREELINAVTNDSNYRENGSTSVEEIVDSLLLDNDLFSELAEQYDEAEALTERRQEIINLYSSKSQALSVQNATENFTLADSIGDLNELKEAGLQLSEISQYLTDFTSADYDALLDIISSDDITTVQELNDAILEYYSTVEEASKISFSELMADEDFTEMVDTFIDKAEDYHEALEAIQEGEFESSDLQELTSTYPELVKYSDSVEHLEEGITTLLGGMRTSIVSNFNAQFNNLSTEEDVEQLQQYMDIVLDIIDVVGNTQISMDIEAETEGMEDLWSAIQESVSSTGLSADSIAALKERYQDLEGYDPSKLFERTTNGIHLNTKALRELEKAYEDQQKLEIDTTLDDLIDQYNDLTNQIDACSDASQAAELYAQRADILEQIDDTSILAAQYDGLTSAFYKWEQAQSIGEEGDMYDSLAGSLEDIEELYEEGLIGTNKFRTAVQLMTNEDLTDATSEELLAAYEAGYPLMTRYFTDSSDGCLNFLNDLRDLNSEWAILNEDGSWDVNFSVGNDEEFAEALGLNVETIQAIMRKLSDYGLDVNLYTEYSSEIVDLELLKTAAEEANESLINLGKTDYVFSFSTDEFDYIVEQIDVAQELLDEFRNDDGTVNLELDGAEEAQTVLDTLIASKYELSYSSAVMSIDTTELENAEQEVIDTIGYIQSFVGLANDLEVQVSQGSDTAETQQSIQDIAGQLATVSEETWISFGVDDEAFLEAIDNIANTDTETGVSVSQDDIDTILNGLNNISADDIEMATNSNEVTSELEAINQYTIKDKSFKVSLIDDVTSTLQAINDAVESATSSSNTLSVGGGNSTLRTKSWGSSAGFSTGTAMAEGDWRTHGSGVALGGELGREIVVRDGRWFTVGDNGAEFFNYQPDDIIFNAEQSEQILKYGKIKNGKKRGTTFAYGSAFADGDASSSAHGTIYLNGSVVTTASGDGDGDGDDEDDSEVIDWIEIAIDRIERAIDNLSTIASSAFRTISERLSASNDEIAKVSSEISLQQAGYNRYIQEANSVGLSADLAERVRNGAIDINEYDGETADLIEQYQEWYEKALDCQDAMLQLTEALGELYQDEFETIATDYENQLSLIEHLTNTYNNSIADVEERGYFVSTKYYEALENAEKQTISTLENELSSLTTAMSNAINSGAIEEGSEAWYSFQESINAVKESVQESNTSLVEFENTIRELKWERFDYLQDLISDITTESDFLIDLMENSNLYTDNGQLTDTGMATMGLHGQNYNVYMAQADRYADEIVALDKEIAEDPYNTDLLERRQELLEQQQEMILAAEDEKDAIVDMVKEGIEIELNALQELIDTYEDALDAQYDLYQYQNDIKEQTAEIASLQKQLSAYEGDTSEETKATIQRLQVELQDAQDDLEETEYEQYISETKKLLDTLYDEYETILNERLDDIDLLISDMIDKINTNSSSITSTIETQSAAVGYTLSDSMSTIWNDGSDITSVLTKYGDDFTSKLTTVNEALNAISLNVAAMVAASDATATGATSSSSVSTTTSTSGSSSSSAKSSTSSSTSSSNSGNSSSSSSFTNGVMRGIAAAIWVYGDKAGWGTGSTRVSRLTDKFGSANAAKVQDYINAHGSNGDLYSYWVSTGKSSLSNYYYSAFKNGGLADYTGLAWLDGTPSDPEMVLDAEDTANFIELKDALKSLNGSSDVLSSLSEVGIPSSTGDGLSIGDISYEINIPIDHVSDYNDLINQMTTDAKFEKFIQSMTVDQLAGRSRIAKNKYQW